MEGIFIIGAIVLAIAGIIGSVIVGVPGPPLAWCGMLVMYIGRCMGLCNGVSLFSLVLWLVAVVVISILDYTIPAKMTRKMGGSKAGSRGAIIGMICGIFFTPIGMFSGALLGAFLGEVLFSNLGLLRAFKAALGTFLGLLVGTFFKVLCCLGILLTIFYGLLN